MRLAAVVALVLVVAACDGSDDAAPPRPSYAPTIDPARFSTQIDNPFLPFRPGTTWVYSGQTDEGVERIVVEVTASTRTVMGVDTVVVHDRATVDGELTEDTFDWYAQDDEGDVWYFGEDTKEYENGEVTSTSGSWEAGVDGAQPGIVMEADPQPGDEYRQEYYAGEAEDMAKVIKLDDRVSTSTRTYTGALTTEEWSPLEPDLVEHKSYVRGVGLVLEVTVKGGSDRVELVSMTGP